MSDRDLTCDRVAERVALGEPLGDLAAHVETCDPCRLLAALPTQLGSTHAAVDPGLGFAARMTAGAQHRIVVRKRRRIASGAAAAVAASVLGVVAFARITSPADVAIAPTVTAPTDPAEPTKAGTSTDPWRTNPDEPHAAAVDPDVRALVHLADIDRDLRGTAHWGRIAKPLRPYRSLVQGVKP